MEPQQEEKAKRVRSLLSSYYGTNYHEGGQSEPSEEDKMNLDNPNFDINSYTRHVARNERLESLQHKYADLVQEIKSLDGDMQNLVYENYSKFIKATDTIREMRSKVGGVASQLSQLESGICATLERGRKVNERLESHRLQIEDLSSLRGLLRRLESVFDLPEKMQACIERDNLPLAADEYLKAKPLLEKFQHGSLSEVKAEVDRIVASMSSQAREALKKPDLPIDEAGRYIDAMRRLDQPVERLREDYVSVQSQKLLRILQSTREKEGLSVRDLAVQLDQHFLLEFAGLANNYDTLFKDREALVAAGRNLFCEYFNLVQERFTPDAENHMPDAKDLTDGLSRVMVDNNGMAQMVPELRLADRAGESVEKALRRHLGNLIESLNRRVMGCFESSDEEGEVPSARGILNHYERACEMAPSALENTMDEMQVLLERNPSLLTGWRDVMVDTMQEHLSTAFEGLCERMKAKGKGGNQLAMARLCDYLDREAVPLVMERIAGGFGEGRSTTSPPFNAGHIQRVLQKCSADLCSRFALGMGNSLAARAREAIWRFDWEEASPPPQDGHEGHGEKAAPPLDMLDFIASSLKTAAEEAGMVLPEESEQGQWSGQGELKPRPQTWGGSLEHGIARMLRGRVEVMSEVRATKQSVIMVAAKCLVKALVEAVRMHSLGRGGFQRLQVACKRLKERMEAAGIAGHDLSLLFEELFASLEERCDEPVSLSEDALASLVAAR